MLGLSLSELVTRLITLVIALTFHEFSHAWTANAFGDDTPRANGRLTLNPLAHLDPIGSLMLILVGFGWAKPVPIDPYNLNRRSPSAVLWVSLAGPFLQLHFSDAGSHPAAVRPYRRPNHSGKFPLGVHVDQFGPGAVQFDPPLSPGRRKNRILCLSAALGAFLDTIRPYSMFILIAVFFVLPYLGVDVFGTVINPVLVRLSGLLLGSNF